MKKFNIIYWSGTGYTEKLAREMAEGVNKDDVQVKVIPVQMATLDDVLYSDIVALGCPAYTVASDTGEEMEEIEDKYMAPFIATLKNIDMSGKTIGLFGSYDWGNGQWIKDWNNRMNYYGFHIVDNGLAIQKDDVEGMEKARQYGRLLAEH